GFGLAAQLIRMNGNEAELAAALAVRGRDERAERRLAGLPAVLRVRHTPALEHDQTAAGGENEHQPSGLAADGDRLRELLDLQHAERALKRSRAAVRPHGLESGHRG